MVAKIGKVREIGRDLDEMTDCDRSVNAKAVRFEKHTFLLEPVKKVVVSAVKFDITKAAVTKNVAADADMRFALLIVAKGDYFEKLLEFRFARRDRIGCKEDLFVLAGSSEN